LKACVCMTLRIWKEKVIVAKRSHRCFAFTSSADEVEKSHDVSYIAKSSSFRRMAKNKVNEVLFCNNLDWLSYALRLFLWDVFSVAIIPKLSYAEPLAVKTIGLGPMLCRHRRHSWWYSVSTSSFLMWPCFSYIASR